jgi:hypothetical protein
VGFPLFLDPCRLVRQVKEFAARRREEEVLFPPLR